MYTLKKLKMPDISLVLVYFSCIKLRVNFLQIIRIKSDLLFRMMILGLFWSIKSTITEDTFSYTKEDVSYSHSCWIHEPISFLIMKKRDAKDKMYTN